MSYALRAATIGLLSVCLLSLAACEDPYDQPSGSSEAASGGPGNSPDPNDPNAPADPNQDPDPGGSPLGCPELSTLIPACNYVTTYEKNIAAGYTEPTEDEDFAATGRTIFEAFQPTTECKDLLAQYFGFDSGWDADPKARDWALNGLHTLFFHPMIVPADGTLYWPNSGHEMELGFMQSVGAMNIPADKIFVLKRDFVNESMIHTWRNQVTKIVYHAYIAPSGQFGEVKMETYSSQIDVNASWLTVAPQKLNDTLDRVRFKYDIASTFLHEMQHADGLSLNHTSCDNHFLGGEKSCDDTMHSAYGRQAMVYQALILGDVYSRMPNSWDLLLRKDRIERNWRVNCLRLTDKVNDAGEWVKNHEPGRETCTGGFAAAFADRAKQPVPSTGALPPPPNDDPGLDWECK